MTDKRLRLARRLILLGLMAVLLGQAVYPFEAGDVQLSAVARSLAPVASALSAWAWWRWLGSVGAHSSGMSRRLLTIFATAYAALAASELALAAQQITLARFYVAFWLTLVGSTLTVAGFWTAAKVFPPRPGPSRSIAVEDNGYGQSDRTVPAKTETGSDLYPSLGGS